MMIDHSKEEHSGHFVLRRTVQFAETDLAGVLHFANYYRMMEEVEHAFWRSLGLGVLMERDGVKISWPRVATNCEYFAPARFEDDIELRLTVAHVGRRSVTYQVEFIRDAERIALGGMTAVCCAMEAGSFGPVDIPEDVRKRLATYVSGGRES